jgi:hypothetical protein
VVSGIDRGNGAPDGLDDPSTLVTEDRGQRSRIHLIANDRVCVTDARGDKAHPNLAGAKFIEFNLFDGEIGLRLARDGGGDLHVQFPLSI